MVLPGQQRRARLVCLLLASSFLASSGFGAPPAVEPRAAAPAAEPAAATEALIYRGTYYLRGAAAPTPRLFWYERRTRSEGALARATHTHRTFDGRVLLRQSVLTTADYELSQFESEQRQTGVSAHARAIDARHVRLERKLGSELESVVLEHRHPLIVGPSLYGMLLRHWDRLAAGRSLVVDFLSIERLDTYAFEIRRVASDASSMTFELAASGFLVSLLVSPLRVVFDTRSRQPLSYEGPSPVQLERGKQLESFDVRIEYRDLATPFR
jgi:hypothetical protein